MGIVDNYKNSYVAFLDVLGFKQMVKSANDSKLSTYFSEVESVVSELKKFDRKRGIGYITISDSIILTIGKSTEKDENLETLRQFCIAISKIQKRLALNDIWLRGAISSGDTYFDNSNNQIVGPAYIDAYLLEEELAKYPRVILDNRIFNDLGFQSSQEFITQINKDDKFDDVAIYDWNKSEFVSKNILNQDVLFFIDYLESVPKDEQMTMTIYNNIRKNLYSDTRLYEKYNWVSLYFLTIAERRKYRDTLNGKKIRQIMADL